MIFEDPKIVAVGNATINSCPRFGIEVKVYSDDGVLLRNFTGANRLVFPNIVQSLTAAQRKDLAETIMETLMRFASQ